ncbi:MAG: hypothetical protein MZV70_54825 [Desulfobacterales bacterium]|nr:hypothetical protein [Desulfobacterales bacterium]
MSDSDAPVLTRELLYTGITPAFLCGHMDIQGRIHENNSKADTQTIRIDGRHQMSTEDSYQINQ